MINFTKREKKELRQLAQKAYETEMNTVLTELHKEFEKWRLGELDSFELDEKIHRYHQDSHRELYKRYAMHNQDHIKVAHAIAKGLISRDSLDPSLLEKIEPIANSSAI